MASLRYTLEITLDGTSTEIPALNVIDTYDLYLIKGTAIAIGNYSLVPTGTPVTGLTYKFQYCYDNYYQFKRSSSFFLI